MDSNFMMMHAGHEHRQAQHLQWTIHSEIRFCATSDNYIRFLKITRTATRPQLLPQNFPRFDLSETIIGTFRQKLRL